MFWWVEQRRDQRLLGLLQALQVRVACAQTRLPCAPAQVEEAGAALTPPPAVTPLSSLASFVSDVFDGANAGGPQNGGRSHSRSKVLP